MKKLIRIFEDIQDVVEKVLIENGHAKVAKEFILYREEAAKRRDEEGRINSKLNENIPWAKVWRNLDWAVEHKLNTVDLLNSRVAKGSLHKSSTNRKNFMRMMLSLLQN